MDSKVKTYWSSSSLLWHAMRCYCSHSRTNSQTVGIQTVGIQTVGIQTVGIQTVGIQTVGIQTVGIQTIGIQKVGIQTIGIQTVGIQTVGIQTVGHSPLKPTIHSVRVLQITTEHTESLVEGEVSRQ